jgi:hypothetical protein
VAFIWSWSKIEQCGNPISILWELFLDARCFFRSTLFGPNSEPPKTMLAMAQDFLQTGTVKTQMTAPMHHFWAKHPLCHHEDSAAPARMLCFRLHQDTGRWLVVLLFLASTLHTTQKSRVLYRAC